MLLYLFLNSCPDYNMCLWGDVYIMKVTKDRATLWHNNPLGLVTRIEIISDTKLLHENMQGMSSSKLEQPELGRRNSRQSHIGCKLIPSSNTAPWAFTFQHKKPAGGPIIHREVNPNLPGKQDIPNICHATLLLKEILTAYSIQSVSEGVIVGTSTHISESVWKSSIWCPIEKHFLVVTYLGWT